jgi:hypothetical protein
MHKRLIKTRILFLGVFALLGMILPAHYVMADGGKKASTHDAMAATAMRGTYMFSTGNIDNPEMIFTKDFVRHEQEYVTPESKTENISKLIESQREIYKVEDMQTEPVNVIVDVKGNMAAVRWSVDVKRSPTADKEFPEEMKFTGVTISRFEQGKIAEQWVYYDSNLVLTLTRMRYKNYFESTKDPAN